MVLQIILQFSCNFGVIMVGVHNSIFLLCHLETPTEPLCLYSAVIGLIGNAKSNMIISTPTELE